MCIVTFLWITLCITAHSTHYEYLSDERSCLSWLSALLACVAGHIPPRSIEGFGYEKFVFVLRSKMYIIRTVVDVVVPRGDSRSLPGAGYKVPMATVWTDDRGLWFAVAGCTKLIVRVANGRHAVGGVLGRAGSTATGGCDLNHGQVRAPYTLDVRRANWSVGVRPK